MPTYSRHAISTDHDEIVAPNDYLALCRVQVASRLLRERPDLGVADVAPRYGFASSQYFATVFYAHIGCSPRDYRQRTLGDGDGANAATRTTPPMPMPRSGNNHEPSRAHARRNGLMAGRTRGRLRASAEGCARPGHTTS